MNRSTMPEQLPWTLRKYVGETQMTKVRHGALRAVVRGAISGAAATAAMDLVLYARFRRGGGKQGLVAWETSESVHTWEDASNPGQVGLLLVKKVTGHKPDDSWARPVSNLVHWATGIAWAAQFGLLRRRFWRHGWVMNLVFGPVVWLSSYVFLPLLKVYKPIWKYDARTLTKDLSAHMVYGSVTAATFAALTRSSQSRESALSSSRKV